MTRRALSPIGGPTLDGTGFIAALTAGLTGLRGVVADAATAAVAGQPGTGAVARNLAG